MKYITTGSESNATNATMITNNSSSSSGSTNITFNHTGNNSNSSCSNNDSGNINYMGNGGHNSAMSSVNGNNTFFTDQVDTVTNLFERWNDCERTVVMFALMKRLRYPSLKLLQYSIDLTLTQSMGKTSNLSAVVIELNANNPSYLQNLLNAYKTFHIGDLVDTMSNSPPDKDPLTTCYGSDFQITATNDERKSYTRKEEILDEVLTMLPLLKPGNEDAKIVYLSLIPLAVKDVMRQIVPIDLVQQIFSYTLIHPGVSNDDRK